MTHSIRLWCSDGSWEKLMAYTNMHHHMRSRVAPVRGAARVSVAERDQCARAAVVDRGEKL
ncbi:hypothetical protein GCM10010216_26650 [Streptomyces flaveolus]|nr:hypothetical protein GCM10010216_26650 [Streptomyces flaveolus]